MSTKITKKYTNVADGKYTFVREDGNWKIPCLRYSEPWIDFEKGSKAISNLLYEFENLQQQRDDLFTVLCRVQKYNKFAKSGRLAESEDQGHEYWCSIQDDVDAIIAKIMSGE